MKALINTKPFKTYSYISISNVVVHCANGSLKPYFKTVKGATPVTIELKKSSIKKQNVNKYLLIYRRRAHFTQLQKIFL